ncbi:NUDIX hydrolase [Acuticoccus mangrovi]|uniref:NUDIX hydrolase n=1 Tax=Acuticoccus mangrovi TaxID=2796142 RepID=A0A934IS68_9HYPH|nr:NUDIX hydrolase [Acuticoccus mangrovi]MBJ3777653.1 NUDIX hydrolase [Acuticoccus mangrovi]
MTTAEELTKRLSAADRDRSHAPVKVRDAASLIILDREGPSVLMGRRSMKHAFMPGLFVFPGGRVDPADARVPVATDYVPATLDKLTTKMKAGQGEARARALGIAALRETYEETGVLIGKKDADRLPQGPLWDAFAARGLGVDLSPLRFVLRAVTPPGRPRRFDTRFFVVDRSAIADIDPDRVGEDAELEEIAWVSIAEAKTMKLPPITLTVLDELLLKLAETHELPADGDVPYYRWQRTHFTRVTL